MKYRSEYAKEGMTKAFESAGAFFAFTDDQYNKVAVDGVDYCSMGAGLIAPVDNAVALRAELDRLYVESIKADLADNGINPIIRRELFNYECFYSSDISECVDALKDYDGISEALIIQQYNHIRRTETDTIF